MNKIMLTRSDEGGLIVARARDGMGWCRFSGGVGLRCQGCGKLVRTGYMSRDGREKRCEYCVTIQEPSQ